MRPRARPAGHLRDRTVPVRQGGHILADVKSFLYLQFSLKNKAKIYFKYRSFQILLVRC